MSVIFTKRNLLVLLFCLLGLGAAYWFLLRPAQAELATLQEEAAALQADVERLRLELAGAESGSDALLEQYNQIRKVDQIIPLADNQTRIQLWTELPQLPNNVPGLTEVQTSAPTNYATDGGVLNHIDINYSVKGSYEAILALVNQINNYPVLLTVESMSIQRDGDSDSWSSSLSVRAWAWDPKFREEVTDSATPGVSLPSEDAGISTPDLSDSLAGTPGVSDDSLTDTSTPEDGSLEDRADSDIAVPSDTGEPGQVPDTSEQEQGSDDFEQGDALEQATP